MSYIPLATVTLGGSDADIVFSNIPAIFKDLIVIASNTNGEVRLQFNSDTGSNYSWVRMWGEGSSAFSSATTGTYIYTGDGTTAPSMVRIQIMDYSSTDKHKSVLAVNSYNPNSVNYNAFTVAGRWANTSAITSIKLNSSGTFQTGSTFSLYGVA